MNTKGAKKMNTKWTVCRARGRLFVLAGLLALSGVTAYGAPNFIPLGALEEDPFFSHAHGVSDDGSIVVGWSDTTAGFRAFRWEDINGNGQSDPGEMQNLGSLPGTSWSEALGISGNGLVVVGHCPLVPEAFRWTSTEDMVGLEDLPEGGFNSAAQGASFDGAVVVGSSEGELGVQAYRWEDLNGNGLVDLGEKLDNHPEFGLGDLDGGGFHSVAIDVSHDGSVIVGRGTSSSGEEAFRWTLGAGMQRLGDLDEGGYYSMARAVSSDGSVVVGRATGAWGLRAFRWEDSNHNGLVDPNEDIQDLGVLNGASESTAEGLSADGLVVVGESGGEVFIWDQVNDMRSLKKILEVDCGLDLTGWTLSMARGVSEDGLTIVGRGTNPSGDTEAWVATIPEPATLGLLALGGLALLRGRKK